MLLLCSRNNNNVKLLILYNYEKDIDGYSSIDDLHGVGKRDEL